MLEVTQRAPGPKGLPFIGSMLPALRDPLGFFSEARDTFGGVVRFKFGPFDYYLVNDPEIVRHVLVENAKAYTKSRSYVGLKFVLGEGLLLSEGEHWRRQRKLAQPAFHRDRLAGFAHQMARTGRDHLDRWAVDGHAQAFDLHRDMMRLTFRIVGRTLFSSEVEGDAREVGEAIDVGIVWANDYAGALFPLPPWIPTPANTRFKRAKRKLDRVVYRLIAERRAQARASSVGSPRFAPRSFGDDLLGMLMEAVDETSGGGMSDAHLRDEVITMILAGHETTANLLSFTFTLLSKHPEVERRVREEVRNVLGERDPALEDLEKLELTRLVLDESLRLYPPAWMFERQAVTGDTLGRYRIEPGSIVGVCTYTLHRDWRYWDDPEAFDPERFRPERSASRPRYAYLPFGGGPRACIGNHFALMEAQILLAMIVREFRIELDASCRLVLDPLITLRPKDGIRVRRRPAP